MNALELADWIENGAPFGKYETAKQAVVMLRQQQAEIDRLEKEIDMYRTDAEKLTMRLIDTAVNPKLKNLSGVEIIGMSGKYDFNYDVHIIEFARAILRKAQEK